MSCSCPQIPDLPAWRCWPWRWRWVSPQPPAPRPHNLIIFVADGLRSHIVTPESAPALAAVRAEGVDFQNSHSVYPTVTTANASAIATGHYLGDTGDFGNTIYVTTPFPAPYVSVLAGIENDAVQGLANDRYGGNYLGEVSLLQAARAKGYATAVLGKFGPVGVQDVLARDGTGTIVIDDGTGWRDGEGVRLSPEIAAAIKAAGLPDQAPDRGLNGGGERLQHGGRARGQCRAAGLVCGRGDQGAAAALQGAGQAVRDGVLVARSGWHPAQPGRQPEHAHARHQRPHHHGGDPQCLERSARPCATR